MTRLPQPGADSGSWGSILNDFLAQAHDADGTIKNGAVGNAQLAQNAVDARVLGVSGGADGQVLAKNSSTTSGLSWIAAGGSSSVSDASTGAKGIVQLAGDLGGTATAPTVPGLATKLNSSEKGAVNGIASLDATGKVPSTQLPASVVTPDASTTVKGIVQLAGDFAGTATVPKVAGIQGVSVSASVPANGQVLSYDGSSWAPAVVTNTTVNDASTGAKGIVQLAGDLGGTASAPTVPGLAAIATKLNSSEKGAVNGIASLDATGKVPSTQLPASTVTPDASTTVKGIVQLTGDLGGTATAPTVPGLAGKANSTHTHAATDIASGTIAAARLGSGTANNATYLRGDGTWATPSTGGSGYAFVTTTVNHTAVSGEYILANAASNSITITLPSPVLNAYFSVKKIDGGGNAITVSGGTIDGFTSVPIFSQQWASTDFLSDGTQWYQV